MTTQKIIGKRRFQEGFWHFHKISIINLLFSMLLLMLLHSIRGFTKQSMTTRGKASFVLQLLHNHRGTSLPPWGKQRIPTALNKKGKISLLLVPTSGWGSQQQHQGKNGKATKQQQWGSNRTVYGPPKQHHFWNLWPSLQSLCMRNQRVPLHHHKTQE